VSDGSPGSREVEGEGGEGCYIAQSSRRADLLDQEEGGGGGLERILSSLAREELAVCSTSPPTRVHFWPLVGAAAMGSHGGVVSGLHRIGWRIDSNITERSLPPSRLLFSSSVARGSFVFSSASTLALLYVAILPFSLVLYPLYFTVAPTLSFLFLSFPREKRKKFASRA
jgi:hypothetical protein